MKSLVPNGKIDKNSRVDATSTAQEAAMQEREAGDKVLNEARKKAAERARLPQAEKESYNVSVISGRVRYLKGAKA